MQQTQFISLGVIVRLTILLFLFFIFASVVNAQSIPNPHPTVTNVPYSSVQNGSQLDITFDQLSCEGTDEIYIYTSDEYYQTSSWSSISSLGSEDYDCESGVIVENISRNTFTTYTISTTTHSTSTGYYTFTLDGRGSGALYNFVYYVDSSQNIKPASFNSIQSTTTTECSTCTRVIETDPEADSTLASTTTSYSIDVEYYVNEDDFCDSFFCTTYIELGVSHATSTIINNYNQQVLSHSTNNTIVFPYDDFSIYGDGTYTLKIQIYNDWLGPFPRNDKLYQVQKFYLDSPTDSLTLQAYASSSRETNWETINFVDDNSDDLGTSDSPGVLALGLQSIYSDFLHLPPWGYVVVFNETITNASSTSISDDYKSLSLSFATSSPAFSKTLDLNLDSAVSSTIATIKSSGVTTEFGDAYDTIIYWWEFIWYLAFAFWILKEIIGIFSMADFSSLPSDRLSKENQKRATLNLKRKSKHDLDLTKV